jgi:hypothetical protein
MMYAGINLTSFLEFELVRHHFISFELHCLTLGKKKGRCVGLDGKTLPLFVGLIANKKLKMGLIR